MSSLTIHTLRRTGSRLGASTTIMSTRTSATRELDLTKVGRVSIFLTTVSFNHSAAAQILDSNSEVEMTSKAIMRILVLLRLSNYPSESNVFS